MSLNKKNIRDLVWVFARNATSASVRNSVEDAVWSSVTFRVNNDIKFAVWKASLGVQFSTPFDDYEFK